jgi:hypothetical protein
MKGVQLDSPTAGLRDTSNMPATRVNASDLARASEHLRLSASVDAEGERYESLARVADWLFERYEQMAMTETIAEVARNTGVSRKSLRDSVRNAMAGEKASS